MAAAPQTQQCSERDELVYKARLAEQAERYDEMAGFMRDLVKLVKDPLTTEERNLLSVAYKNSVGSRRASLRVILNLEGKQKKSDQAYFAEITRQYREKVMAELEQICNEIIDLLKRYLPHQAHQEVEAKVFYQKMHGDYLRYLCEFAEEGPTRKALADEACKAYQLASDIGSKELNATHPVRLGLALNFSVFYYEILGKPEVACQIAKSAFDDSIAQLDTVEEDSYRDSTLIMQLLRDNLTLWTEADANAGAQGEAPPEAS